MEKHVIFLETDPAFLLVYRAYSELGPRLNHRGTRTAKLVSLYSRRGNFNFGSNYDFGRRASVASRISMCVATGLPLRNWARNQHNIEPEVKLQPGGAHFNLDSQLRDYFVPRFDQMFPHHIIQEKLNNQKNFSLPSRMLIFRLEKNIVVDIIEMTTTITGIHNNGYVNCSITTIAVNSLLVPGEDGPWYRHLQSICFQPHVQDVHLPCVEEHQHPDDDDDSDSDDTDWGFSHLHL